MRRAVIGTGGEDGVYGKVINALLRLLDWVSERSPRELFGATAGFRGLINCRGADGDEANRMIHSPVAWMFLPVERSMTVSAPHLVAQRIFSTSSSIELATALLPMLALILTRKLRPMIIGSSSG